MRELHLPPTPRTWELPPDVKVSRVNGYDMAFVERGAGIPVLFVHGTLADYRFFSAQMGPFSSCYRAIAVSLRHYYPEPWRGEGSFSLNEHVADLVEFIRELRVGPIHLIGHSRGGSAALYVARRIPQLVRSLTIAEGGTGMSAFSSDDTELRDRLAVTVRTITDKLSRGDTEGGIDVFLEFVAGPGVWNNMPEPFKQWLRDNAWTLAAYESDPGSWEPFSREDAKQLDVPVLLLGGERSPAHFGDVLDKLEACLPHVQRQVVANSGHALPLANPEAFNATVMSFIGAR